MAASLTLQALLKTAIARMGIGASAVERVTGLPPSAQALYLAAAAQRQAPAVQAGHIGATLVVVVPTDADVEQMTADTRFFLAALEGLSETAVQDAVLQFPSHEVDPYRGLAPHLGVLSARTRALHAAATGTARAIIASATALLPRVSAPARMRSASLELRAGADIDPYDLAALLVDAGFTRTDPVDAHGEFCVRGGVIDIFPAGSAQPVRLDFVGDTIESIRQFDPSTQRSTGEIERTVIVPLREVFPGDNAADGAESRGGDSDGDEDFADADSANEDSAIAGSAKRRSRGAIPATARSAIAGFATEEDELAVGDDEEWDESDEDDDSDWEYGEVDEADGGARRSSRGKSGKAKGGRQSAGVPVGGSSSAAASGRASSGATDVDSVVSGAGSSAGSTSFDARRSLPSFAAFFEGADRSAWLLDFVSRPIVFVCEPEDVRARAEKSLEQLTASYDDIVSRIDASPDADDTPKPPAPSEVLVGLDDICALFELGTTIEELQIDTEPGGAEAPPHGGGVGAREVSADHRPVAVGAAISVGAPLVGARDTAESREPRAESPPRAVTCRPAVEFRGRIGDWVNDVKRARAANDTVLFVAATAGRAERVLELLRDYEMIAAPVFVDQRQRDTLQALARTEMTHAASVLVAIGALSRGFHLPGAALHVFAETDVFEEERRPSERRRSAARAFLSDFRDLKVGDHVVHVEHGIGRFVGLKQIGVDAYAESSQEFLELRYAGDDKLFVPVERLDLLQKYTGATKPPLDRLGGTTWERAKTRVKKAMRDMAEELLKLYAARKAMPGHSFGPDTHWQEEFEGAFAFDLTVDQDAAITDIKRDMQSTTPMDRLLCGDVGYGKTEVAMRAAFKAVMDGKQVAFLAPTTVLAFQHLKTLRERFAGFPVRAEMVSRFRSKAEIKQALADLEEGKVEIIVGTHRLLSKDVIFRDLGLLVVDEEQRFGVAHKERIKQMRRKVDVLTMTATPIPRTLNMSLVGIRDMSVIETPPKDRLAIQTNVVRFDQQVIARAVRQELQRGGQVYFVHNRVESIYSIGDLLRRLVPEAKVVVGHGQMGEDELERAMVDFVARKFDILLATTIVENGLDIPNVNTIIINRADRYGLSQLYQLRGRVGRSDRPAYAYLLIPPGNTLSPIARKRLAAIREFSDLGSGFRVAALDLEIRGAGNLLGGEQSGHIETIGFEMYMKLLEQTVKELKGEELEDETRATVNLNVDLRIDEKYVPEQTQRLMLYRRVAGSRSDRELDEIVAEITDRYGPMPDEVRNLVEYGRIRILADRLGIESIDRQGSIVVLTFKASSRSEGVDPQRVLRLVAGHPDVVLVPPSGLKLDLNYRPETRRVGPNRDGLIARNPAGAARPGQSPGFTAGRSGPVGGSAAGRRLVPGRLGSAAKSWWTARATEEEVKPGFSKEAILRPTKEDPRGPTGVLTKVRGVLSELRGPM